MLIFNNIINKEQEGQMNNKSENTQKEINEAITEETDNTAEKSENSEKRTSYIDAEDNLELRKMKFTERLRAKRERFKQYTADMTGKQKLGYFVYYYKWTVLLTVIAVFLAIAIPVTIYKNSRPVAISYAVINRNSDLELDKTWVEDYISYYGFDGSFQVVDNTSVYLDPAEYDENTVHNNSMTDYSQFPIMCHNDYFDVIITDMTGLKFCSEQAVIQPLSYGMYPDLYKLITDKYSDDIVVLDNYLGEKAEFAIDITDTEFAKKLNSGYDRTYVCFSGGSEQNFSNNRKFLNFILDLGLEL